MTRAVLFDVGETLIERPAVGPGRRIATALGLPDDAARLITQLVFAHDFASPAELAARLQRELGLAHPPTAVVEEIWRAQEQEPREIPGATACVAAVRELGARIGVVSNIWQPYETGFRRACPAIAPLVEVWQLSYRAGRVKPAPGLFRAALDALDVAPERAIMVGDSLEKDVLPAVALGMRAVWVRRGEGSGADGAVSALPERSEVARDLDEARTLVVAALQAALPSPA